MEVKAMQLAANENEELKKRIKKKGLPVLSTTKQTQFQTIKKQK